MSIALDFSKMETCLKESPKGSTLIHDLNMLDEELTNFYCDLLTSDTMSEMKNWGEKPQRDIMDLLIRGGEFFTNIANLIEDTTILAKPDLLSSCMDKGRFRKRRLL